MICYENANLYVSVSKNKDGGEQTEKYIITWMLNKIPEEIIEMKKMWERKRQNKRMASRRR